MANSTGAIDCHEKSRAAFGQLQLCQCHQRLCIWRGMGASRKHFSLRYCRCGLCECCPEHALHLFDRMGLQKDIFSYNSAISACEKGSRLQETSRWETSAGSEDGLELLDMMCLHQLQPDVFTFSSLISACEKTSSWPLALDLLCSMGRWAVRPNTVSFNACISAAGGGGAWQLALELLRMLEQLVDAVSGHAAISACEECGQWEAALHILTCWMPSNGLPVHVIGVSSAISACEKSSRWMEALQLLRNMGSWRCQANDISYNSALKAAERAGRWQISLLLGAALVRGCLLEEMEEVLGADLIAYNTACMALSSSMAYQSGALRSLPRLLNELPCRAARAVQGLQAI
ncbi:unnamed protein product [Cladocopium goreaui]|uniref:Pentatricopeptide repeat-containing protein, chloroplastic n=1 Tax=Cladocopium goreaui TaxID=2562237 RepID=A0A9P1DAW3_9DINO|nr:unnamed protein product [Cladocopium goreaui]